MLQLLHAIGSPATVAQSGGRYFGFVNGSILPPVVAAKWLIDTWDQNPALYVISPVSAYLEAICERWQRPKIPCSHTTQFGIDNHLIKETSMRAYHFEKLDAFATDRSTGNPAAMIVLESQEDIEPAMMQRIARELKGYVSETGFVWPARDADFELRYYSSEQEVGFCGHATVAIMHRLISSQGELQDRRELKIRTRDTELRVINRVREDNRVYLFAPAPGFLSPDLLHQDIAAALDLPVANIDTDRPPVIVDLGQKILLVPLTSPQVCRSLDPNFRTLREFCLCHDIQIITVYAITGDGADIQLSTRVFPPVYGYLEDPATGSGNAALGYTLLRDGRWDGKPLTIRQGSDHETPNLVYLCTLGDKVLIGGSAICRLSGTYYLP